MTNNNMFADQTNQYTLTITMQWMLKPVAETLDILEKKNVLFNDRQRAANYRAVKKRADDIHRVFIDRCLTSDTFEEWESLKNALQAYQKAKKKSKTDENEDLKEKKVQEAKDNLEMVQGSIRKKIAERFTKDRDYQKLFSKKLFTELFPLKQEISPASDKEEESSLVDVFDKFYVYFKGYHENRKNMYSNAEQSTAIANRIVHDNFPRFLNNMSVFKQFLEEFTSSRDNKTGNLDTILKPVLEGKKLEDVFSLEFFNQTQTQKGIDFYNQVLGGITDKKLNTKIQGINELINLQRQKEKDKQKKIPFMVPLYKQILSECQTNSYVPDAFLTDSELLETIQNFYEQGLNQFLFAGKPTNVLEGLTQLIVGLNDFDSAQIQISNKEITNISHAIFGDWDYINTALESYAQTLFVKKSGKDKGKTIQKKIDSWLSSKEFSLADIHAAFAQNDIGISFESFWEEFSEEKKKQTKRVSFPQMAGYIDGLYKELNESVFKKAYSENSPLGSDENQKDVDQLKVFLDAIQDFLHAVKPFDCSNEANKDSNFYDQFQPYYDQLKLIIDLYNKTRNYLTQKAASASKIRLKFDMPTLGDGWDVNKEKDNGAIILRRNGQYYLAILNPHNKSILSELSFKEGEPAYEKMRYKLIADPSKDLPNLMVINNKTVMKKGRKGEDGDNKELEDLKNKYLPRGINRIRKEKTYSNTSDHFSADDLRKYIDYYMNRLVEYEKNKFSYTFKKPEEYTSYDDFLADVKLQSYKISFENVSARQIDQWVMEGKLFCFQIYNKDFAPGAKGRKNLHTLYWLECFSRDNLCDVVYKLNGEAELFLREKSPWIKTPVVHRKGEQLLNRRLKTGTVINNKPAYTIPENLYVELYKYVNNKIAKSELSEEARLYLPSIVIKPVTHEIIKDRRYVQQQFFFHVPITINFKCDKTIQKQAFDQKVQKLLSDNRDQVQIIGLDRGENNLIYLTRIDHNGEILEQKSFNIIETKSPNDGISLTDYQAKLSQRQNQRKEARQSWKTIGQVKDLKVGYVSQVVHEIVSDMIHHKAILVMENLNRGFKRGRIKIDKQVYQKFEKALIDKLNYLVFKDREPNQAGGVRNGYQLTLPIQKYSDMFRQNGFLFYVPAEYTSTIDPTTGFVNLVNTRYETIAKAQALLTRFDSIRYNPRENYFEFELDYDRFVIRRTPARNCWTVCTHGGVRYANNKKVNPDPIDVTRRLCSLFDKYNIVYGSGSDFKELIVAQTSAAFFKELLFLLGLTLQLRYSGKGASKFSKRDEDYILSPVRDKTGRFFDSREYFDVAQTGVTPELPQDADANGAYHIALKGLWLLKNGFPTKDWAESKSWFRYRQNGTIVEAAASDKTSGAKKSKRRAADGRAD